MRCLCTPLLSPPFTDTSSALPFGFGNVPPPDSGVKPLGSWQLCPCACPSTGFCQSLVCHHDQNCVRPHTGTWTFPTSHPRPYPCLISHNSPSCAQRSRRATHLDKHVHFHPQCPPARLEHSGKPAVVTCWTAFPRAPVQDATDLSERQPTHEHCTIYSLDAKALDLTCQHGYSVPSMTMHYAVYSSPVPLCNESHRFPNNVPPVLLAVCPTKQGSPPHLQELAQIDRSPTPSIPTSYLAFSRD